MASEASEHPWAGLTGAIAVAVLRAPKTGGDPNNRGDWPAVHGTIVSYLETQVAGRPWADHLALAAAVQSARRSQVSTVAGMVRTLHARFADLFPALGLATMAEWTPEQHLPAYLKGELLPGDSPSMRVLFWSRYRTAARHVQTWLGALPEAEGVAYRRWALPAVHPLHMYGVSQAAEVQRQQRRTRKAETDAVVPQFTELRAEAHYRYNRLLRLRRAAQAAVQACERGQPPTLPLAFSYEEGGDPATGLPAQERLHFRLWDRRSFILAHPDRYCRASLFNARKGARHCAAAQNGRFVEFVRAERLTDTAPPQGLWFAELLQRGLLGKSPRTGTAEEVAAKQAWLRGWGYGEDEGTELATPFETGMAGLLAWSKASGDGSFMREAQEAAAGVLLPVEPLFAAATFGLLAVDLFTTTGMRINEAMQVRPSPDCCVRLAMPAPPGAADQTPRIRYVLRLIPKGERTDRPHDYFIGKETVRLLVKVAQLLAEHYGLTETGRLPAVRFNPGHGRAYRFGQAPYLFQYGRRHLSHQAITACMRFLLHGMVFRTRDGRPVTLKPHLLRHAFATHTVQVEHIPLDIVGAWLQQKNLDVTDYYSKPTESMIADAADRYLARLVARVNVGEAVRRSPVELQQLYDEAKGKAGTLAEVIGGHCVSHGFCAAKFACIGCAGKVPDPAKRQQVERHQRWALQQVAYATGEGLHPEAERMRQLARDCAGELLEMDQIEAYRRDEGRETDIRIEPAR